jgi:hypothetical protein
MALARRDWPAAYQKLDEPSRAAASEEQFAQQAASYLQSVGFAFATVQVQSCDERGDGEAVAHVSLTSGPGASPKYYRDGVALRKHPAGWGVVLAPTFGRGSTRK